MSRKAKRRLKFQCVNTGRVHTVLAKEVSDGCYRVREDDYNRARLAITNDWSNRVILKDWPDDIKSVTIVDHYGREVGEASKY